MKLNPIPDHVDCKREHDRILNLLFYNKEIIQEALNTPPVWIRALEYRYDPQSDERADMVFQDKFDPYKKLPETTCYVVEVKSDEGDHEVLGQLKKAVSTLEKNPQGQWDEVKGVAVAKRFTDSGKKLLEDEGYFVLEWHEVDGQVELRGGPEKPDPELVEVGSGMPSSLRKLMRKL